MSEMKISAECFNDIELRSLIKGNKLSGDCDILHKKNTKIYDTDKDSYLADAIRDTLYIFKECNNKSIKSKTIGEYFQEFRIFNSEIKANQITQILKNIFSKEEETLFDKPMYIPEDEKLLIIQNGKSWDDFSKNIKYVNRFHSKFINEENLELLLSLFKANLSKKNLYRARIHKTDKELEENDMWAPPKDKATPGRINPENIRCFYLSNNKKAVIKEVRAVANDRLAIATFNVKPEFKEKLWLINFDIASSVNIFGSGDTSKAMRLLAINKEIIENIISEISKPLRSFDRPIEYTPIQFIRDYIKIMPVERCEDKEKEIYFSGVAYKSVFDKNAINYAFFCNDVEDEKNKFIYKGIKHIDIKNVNYKV